MRSEGQHWATKPGNFYSKPVKVRLDPSSGTPLTISMDQVIAPIQPPADTKQVKYIKFQSDRLTKFWGTPTFMGAIVLLPAGWDTHPNAHYPVLIHQGHFPKDMQSDAWRETPPGLERDWAEAGGAAASSYQFYKGLERPELPADDPRPHPASDSVL